MTIIRKVLGVSLGVFCPEVPGGGHEEIPFSSRSAGNPETGAIEVEGA